MQQHCLCFEREVHSVPVVIPLIYVLCECESALQLTDDLKQILSGLCYSYAYYLQICVELILNHTCRGIYDRNSFQFGLVTDASSVQGPGTIFFYNFSPLASQLHTPPFFWHCCEPAWVLHQSVCFFALSNLQRKLCTYEFRGR